ncbi:MAG: hypothetical protein AMDU1_APLC00047G0007 [Thermoplasmatales archaeon A-plasma]|jgi:hypothetical protein|nr:MAG: hypothetical protein AMDU1_APLC00047G0007 [Thermoplasmatales archaeon A-plasma]
MPAGKIGLKSNLNEDRIKMIVDQYASVRTKGYGSATWKVKEVI